MKKVALLMLGISNISGGGGAERQFSDFFDYYTNYDYKRFKLFLITDYTSLKQLQSIGRLKNQDNVILLPSYTSNKINFLMWNLFIFPILYKNKIDVLHITIPSYFYLPFLYLLNFMPKRLKPKIILNAIDCTISYNYFNKNPENSTNQLNVYKAYFKYIKLDAIYSWYEHFKKIFDSHSELFIKKPYTESTKYCFANLELFKPIKKEKNIIFAGRLIEQKQPLMFVNAIKKISEVHPEIFNQGWKFYIYGKGILEDAIKAEIVKFKLQDKLILTHSSNMNTVLSKSMVFISTQNLENFTSLSMLEAMACGNVIISRDVGQTNYFVKDGINGFLLKNDTPDILAETIFEYTSHFNKYKHMGQESVKLATEVHNIENFTRELELFWDRVVSNV